MNSPENKQNESDNQESVIESPTKSEQSNNDTKARISQIENELDNFNYHVKSKEEMDELQKQRNEEYQEQIQNLEDMDISEESRQIIQSKMVDDVIGQAQQENERHDALNTEKNKLEMHLINEYIKNALSNEESSLIAEPMNSKCKIAVMVPAYNESYDNILRSLESLSDQEEVDPNSFEIDFVVNNKKSDAEQNTDAFKTNQKALKLIEFINGNSEEIPENLTEDQKKIIEQIKNSGIKINAINKSSIENADEENNVGIARNRAGAEIAKRFIDSSNNINGAIAITDCDCTFSKNYIKSLIDSFGENKINGVSGNLEFEIDSSLPNSELTQQAFDIYMGIDRNEDKSKKYEGEDNFKPKNSEEKKGTLQAGANMAVNVRSWGLVNGMPKFSGGEDIRFGQRVEKLRGSVAKNYDYTITTLIRASERTGVQGLGRIVKKMNQSINDFVAGKTDKVYIEDKEKVNKFYNTIIESQKQNKLTGDLIIEEMKKNNFKESSISNNEFNELANEINLELSKQESEQDIRKIENLILEKIYPYYPEKDITDKIEKELNKK